MYLYPSIVFRTKKERLWTLVIASVMAVGLVYVGVGWEEGWLFRGDDVAYDQLNPGGVNDIAALPLQEAKRRLNYLVVDTRDSIRNTPRLSDLSLKVMPIQPEVMDQIAVVPEHQEPLTPFTSKEVAAAIAALAPGSVNFLQRFDVPESELTWNVQALDGIWAKAASDNATPAQYRFQQVYFRDGTEQPYADLLAKNADANGLAAYNSSATLTTGKPIDKVRVEVSYRSYPDFRKVVLSREHPRVTSAGGESYQLTALQDGTATLLISTPRAGSYAVQGLDDAGLALRNNSDNASSVLSDDELANLNTLHEGLLAVQDDINRFKDSQSLQTELQSLAQRLSPKPDSLKHVQAQYRYDVTPTTVEVFVFDPPQLNKSELILSNRQPVQALYVAHDQPSDRYGFIDATGAWKIKPVYESIQPNEVPGLYRVVTGTREVSKQLSEVLTEYRYLQPGTLDFTLLPFASIELIINADLLLVQGEENGPYGIYNLRTQAFTLPLKFARLSVQGAVMVACVGDKAYECPSTYGAYNVYGKPILAPEFAEVSQFDEFLYATSADRQRHDVYDLDGKKINPAGYDAVGRFFDDQPLLAKSIKTGTFMWVGKRGNGLPIKLPYDDVQPFSNGLAVVRRGGLSGAIDVQGGLRIPLAYTSIEAFQNRFAAATPRDGFAGLVLIDQHNNVRKQLGAPISLSVFANSNDAEYRVRDPQNNKVVRVYDADGRELSGYEEK